MRSTRSMVWSLCVTSKNWYWIVIASSVLMKIHFSINGTFRNSTLKRIVSRFSLSLSLPPSSSLPPSLHLPPSLRPSQPPFLPPFLFLYLKHIILSYYQDLSHIGNVTSLRRLFLGMNRVQVIQIKIQIQIQIT